MGLIKRRINADRTVAALDEIIRKERGRNLSHPLRQRARTHRQRSLGLVPLFREPELLQSSRAHGRRTRAVESFGSRSRDEMLSTEQ